MYLNLKFSDIIAYPENRINKLRYLKYKESVNLSSSLPADFSMKYRVTFIVSLVGLFFGGGFCFVYQVQLPTPHPSLLLYSNWFSVFSVSDFMWLRTLTGSGFDFSCPSLKWVAHKPGWSCYFTCNWSIELHLSVYIWLDIYLKQDSGWAALNKHWSFL